MLIFKIWRERFRTWVSLSCLRGVGNANSISLFYKLLLLKRKIISTDFFPFVFKHSGLWLNILPSRAVWQNIISGVLSFLPALSDWCLHFRPPRLCSCCFLCDTPHPHPATTFPPNLPARASFTALSQKPPCPRFLCALFLLSCQMSLFCPLTSRGFLFMSPLSTHIFIFLHPSPIIRC